MSVAYIIMVLFIAIVLVAAFICFCKHPRKNIHRGMRLKGGELPAWFEHDLGVALAATTFLATNDPNDRNALNALQEFTANILGDANKKEMLYTLFVRYIDEHFSDRLGIWVCQMMTIDTDILNTLFQKTADNTQLDDTVLFNRAKLAVIEQDFPSGVNQHVQELRNIRLLSKIYVDESNINEDILNAVLTDDDGDVTIWQLCSPLTELYEAGVNIGHITNAIVTHYFMIIATLDITPGNAEVIDRCNTVLTFMINGSVDPAMINEGIVMEFNKFLPFLEEAHAQQDVEATLVAFSLIQSLADLIIAISDDVDIVVDNLRAPLDLLVGTETAWHDVYLVYMRYCDTVSDLWSALAAVMQSYIKKTDT